MLFLYIFNCKRLFFYLPVDRVFSNVSRGTCYILFNMYYYAFYIILLYLILFIYY